MKHLVRDARYARAILPIALAVVSGCADEIPAACRDSADFYTTRYTELSGTCGDYAGHGFHVSHTLATTIQVFDDGTEVTSEIVQDDCRLRVTQIAQRRATIVERVDGELQIRENGSATGEVTLKRFDDSGELACSGEYDAVLVPAGSR
jgi:hypothetical protein